MLVPFPVIASNPSGTGADNDSLTSGVTATGTGGVTVVGTFGDILSGSLPTSINLDFTIDPLGLLDLGADDEVSLEPVSNIVDFGEEIIRVWNTGSVPLLVNANLSATVGANTTLSTTVAGVTAGNTAANNVLFWMEPNEDLQTTATATFNGLGKGIVITGTAQNAHFLLEARPHRLFATGSVGSDNVLPVELRPVTGSTAQFGTSFRFGGVININEGVTWHTAGDMTLNATFTIARASAAAIAAGTDGDIEAYGMLNDYAGYTRPALIEIPEGVSGGGGALQANAQGFVAISITAASLMGANVVPVSGGAQTWIASTDSARFFHNTTTNTVFVQIPTGTHDITLFGPGSVNLGTFKGVR